MNNLEPWVYEWLFIFGQKWKIKNSWYWNGGKQHIDEGLGGGLTNGCHDKKYNKTIVYFNSWL